jgi:hypothetical protein
MPLTPAVKAMVATICAELERQEVTIWSDYITDDCCEMSIDDGVDIVALAAAVVIEPVVFDFVADSGTTYHCVVDGPAHILVQKVEK